MGAVSNARTSTDPDARWSLSCWAEVHRCDGWLSEGRKCACNCHHPEKAALLILQDEYQRGAGLLRCSEEEYMAAHPVIAAARAAGIEPKP